MLKVMIVDDEWHIIDTIKKAVNWGNIGYEVCSEETDGLKAAEKLESCRPDVVITDISMPDFDGLKLARYMKEKYPKTKIILLTGYENFNYAKDAISIGVSYYALKPVNGDEVEKLLVTLKHQIENENESEKNVEELILKAELSERVIKEKFIYWLVSCKQSLTPEEIASRMDFYKIPLKNGIFNVISIEMEGIKGSDKESIIQESIIRRIMDEVLQEYDNRFIFHGNGGRMNVIVGRNFQTGRELSNIRILCEELRLCIKESLKSSPTVGVGSNVEGYANLFKSYYEAGYALKYRFFMGNNRVIDYNSIEVSDMRNAYCSNEKKTDILLNLRICNRDGVKKVVCSILDDLKRRNVAVECLQTLCIDLILTGISFANESNINLQDIFNSHFDPIEEINNKGSFEEVLSWIIDYFIRLIDCLIVSRQPAAKRTIERAVKFIKDGIEDSNLSATMVSKGINNNENYLSLLFKKELGMPLVKYINNYRLEKAKGYLDEGWCNIFEVARKVGYDDQFYFSKCFKKRFGVSPSKYLGYK